MSDNAVIRVIGVGGCGNNAVSHMLGVDIQDVEFICVNTDVQALQCSEVKNTLAIGSEITKGLGAGANPEIGRQSALEDIDKIRQMLKGTDMLFITLGAGGGTGSGAGTVIAEVAKEQDILTVAVVTMPFGFEGAKRMQVAKQAIAELSQVVDSLIVVPNNKLLTSLGKGISLIDAFKASNNVLANAVRGISELITKPGIINVDFADVCAVMSGRGIAMMGIGMASGDNKAKEAASAAIASPLLDDVELSGAKGVLINITGGPDMSIAEFDEVGEAVTNFTADNATIIIGTVIDPNMEGKMRVTLVATGLGSSQEGSEVKVERDFSFHNKHMERSRSSSVSKRIRESNKQADYLDIPAFLRKQAD